MLRLLLLAAVALSACSRPPAPPPAAAPARIARTTSPPRSPEPVIEAPDVVSAAAANPAREVADSAELAPAAFQGEWNADLARCGTDLGEMRLLLTGRAIGLYESGGPIMDVMQEDEVTVTLRARLSGEGETWEQRFRLRLAEDGRTLTDITRETPVVRQRCPGVP